MSSTTSSFTSLPTTTTSTTAGVTHVDLNFASEMTKGSGTIFVTDGAIQTVIDRVTGLPKMRVVGATFTKEIPLDQVHVSGSHVMFDAAGLAPGLSYNIYMAPGTLTSGGRAFAGFSAPGQSSFHTPEVVVVPPPSGLSATIELEGSSLKSGEQIFAIITFSKPVTTLDPATLATPGAAISYLSSHDEGKTWVATLTGLAATDAPANTLRLDMAAVTAADGSHGAGVVQSSPYLVDTLVEAHVGPGIDMDADAGPYRDDGVTNEDTMSVSGLLYGTLKSGEVFELTINGHTVDPSKIQITSTYGSGVFYWSYASDSEHFNPGENSVQARIVGGAHSSLSATKTVVVETDAPDIVAAPTTPIDASKAFTISFDEKMYWDDNREVSGEIRVVDGFGNTSWIDLDNSQLSEDRMSLTFEAGEHNFATGNSYRIYLPSDLTDLAGNRYAGPAIRIDTAGVFQDKAPPRLLQAYIASGNGAYGKGDVLEFRLRYSEKVLLDAGTVPQLDLTNNGVATYVGLSADGREMIFTYTVAAGDDEDSLGLYTPWSLTGHVRDEAGNILQRAHIEYDGLSTAGGYGAHVEIDTVAWMPDRPQLHADSDTGTPGDGITTDATPRLHGLGAEAYAAISLYDGEVLVGSTTADGEGKWDTVLGTALDKRTHTIRVSQQDAAGNVSELSAGLSLTVIGLSPLSVSLDAGSDTGASSSDRLTADNRPTIAGRAAANTTLKLTQDGADIALVTTDEHGDWNYRTDALDDGVHNFSVRYSDTAGHTVPAAASVSITVDRAKPSVAASPDGSSGFNIGTPVVISFSEALQWHAAEDDSDMLVLRETDGTVRKIALQASNFSNDGRTLTIGAGEHGLKALTDYGITLPSTLTDLAGNSMGEYQIYFRTGDDVLPSAVKAIVSGDHSFRAGEAITFHIQFNEAIARVGSADISLGLSNGGRAGLVGIEGNEAHFAYTVETGQDALGVTINDTAALVGNLADLSGNLLDVAHIVFSSLYDGSGYGSHIDIDTVAPSALSALLHADSNSGAKDDLLTNVRTPTLTGTGAEAWADIELYRGDIRVGEGYADGQGNWEASVDWTSQLADGEHQLSVRQFDAAGNRGAQSTPVVLHIDTTVTPLGAPRLAQGYDTGASATDNLTREDEVRLAGSGAEAGATITILAGDTVIGSGSADDHGNWTAELVTELGNGEYTFTAMQKDAAGNLSAPSAALVFTVDRSAPAAPGKPVLAAGSDSGVLDNDGITKITTPTFSGGGAEAFATVVLYAGTREIGSATANADGNWTLAVLEANKFSTDGSYAITAKQVDKAGNTSAASSAFDLVIDTAGPVVGTGLVNIVGRKFSLPFNEAIVFSPSGQFKLLEGSVERGSYLGNNNSGWSVTADSHGDFSILNFNISLNGLLKLQSVNGSVTDLAGNVAVIGQPEWEFTMPISL